MMLIVTPGVVPMWLMVIMFHVLFVLIFTPLLFLALMRIRRFREWMWG